MSLMTGYELSGEQRNTTREEEQDFLYRLAATTSAELEVVGHSVLGFPIWCISVGSGSTVMVVANVHPREFSGREAALMWIRDLATEEPSYLQNHRVVVIPNVLVDGMDFPRRRNNINDININRDYMALTQPESRAVARAVQKERPVMIMDMHRVSNDLGHAWRPYWDAPEQAHPDLLALGEGYTNQAAQNVLSMDSSYTTLPYARTLVPWGQLATTASAWHAVGILNEVSSNLGFKNTVDVSRNTIDTFRQFHESNREALDNARQNSIDSRLSEPIRVPSHERVYQGDDVYVDPTGEFEIQGTVPEELFSLHGIEHQDGVVSLDQPAQRIVAYLLSSESIEYIPNEESWAYAEEGTRSAEGHRISSTTMIADGDLLYPSITMQAEGDLMFPAISMHANEDLLYPTK